MLSCSNIISSGQAIFMLAKWKLVVIEITHSQNRPFSVICSGCLLIKIQILPLKLPIKLIYLMASQAIKAVIGKAAPFFKANCWISSTSEFKELSLTDYKSKWLLLFFYPLDFSFVCPTQIVQFSNHSKTFRMHNCQIVGCSIDSHFVHRRWTLEPRSAGGVGNIEIPLISDIKKEIAAGYGVLNDGGLALRGTFLIDNHQILRHISINDLGVGRNVPDYLRLLQAFQFHAENGEVCPAGWTKGSASINTKLDSSVNDYWKNVHAMK